MNLWQGGNADAFKAAILDLQFRGIEAHQKILRNKWETKENIIEMDAVPIGRFVVSGDSEELRLAEIAVLDQWRGKGIGQMVVQATKAECEQSGRVMRLWVEQTNPAVLFYRTLGFYEIDRTALHFIMEWNPKGPTKGRLYFHGMASAAGKSED